MPRSTKRSLSFRFQHGSPVCISLLPHTCHMHHPSHHTWSGQPNDICWNSKNHEAPHHEIFSSLLLTSSLLGEQTSSSVPQSPTPSAYCLPLTWQTHFHSPTEGRKITAVYILIFKFQAADELLFVKRQICLLLWVKIRQSGIYRHR